MLAISPLCEDFDMTLGYEDVPKEVTHAPHESWVQTYNGVQFLPFDPRVEDIHIEDIAHSLSMQVRWNGHLKVFFSTAQHSVNVSYHVPPGCEFWGLMHDADEYIVGDLCSPIKWFMPQFREVEDRIAEAVRTRFNIPYDEHIRAAVKKIDTWMAFQEGRAHLRHPELINLWQIKEPHYTPFEPVDLRPWTPKQAKKRFLARFREITKQYMKEAA
jgi:hypothetical protein